MNPPNALEPALTAQIIQACDETFDETLRLSKLIHAHPELRFEERQAAGWLATALEQSGFALERGLGGLPTAFRGLMVRGAGSHVTLLAEYDALEGLGHACGHNLIGAMATGAGLALARVPGWTGTLSVTGCPAEEGGGGKVMLLEAGAFAGIDAALMIHPFAQNVLAQPFLARAALEVTFHGRAAHAALAPHEGINALDAANLFFAGLNALRQHVTPDVRLHGVIQHGGDAPNIIPAQTRLLVVARAARGEYLFENLLPRVRAVIDGAALMTGCTVSLREPVPAYKDVRANPVLLQLFREVSFSLGREFVPEKPLESASTDLGNVSHAIPTIHPYYSLGWDAQPHTPEFERAAISLEGERCLRDGVRALAISAATLLTNPQLVADAWHAQQQALE